MDKNPGETPSIGESDSEGNQEIKDRYGFTSDQQVADFLTYLRHPENRPPELRREILGRFQRPSSEAWETQLPKIVANFILSSS